ncbi:MAG: DUF222 domain-containing protein [Candidatus Dormibacteraeota bacterium]|nr:DUF222 domain-containing protein [Candidatus Dormibacteraeota bacterium]
MRYLRGVFEEIVGTRERLRVVAEELRLLLRRRDQLSLEASRLAGELARAGFGEAMGSISTPDWIRHECQLGYQAAADLVFVGLELDSLGASVAALEEAEIGFQHLVLIARTHHAVSESEHLLAEAREVSVSRFRHLCQEARHAADPEGVAREQGRAMEERAFRLSQQEDGRVTLSGILDPIGGAAVKAALEPLARLSGRLDRRRRERRLADALVELAQHSMDQGSPRQRPHLNVTATLGTLYMNPGSAAAEMDHGDPVSGVTVGRIACDCSIRRHVFDSASLLVELGRRKRVVSPQLRKALESRDRHCRWPGCTRPGSWCEAHHVVPWIRGGATNPDNLLLLCSRHHVQVHEGRWHLLVDPHGRVEVIRPPLDFAAPPRGPAAATAA